MRFRLMVAVLISGALSGGACSGSGDGDDGGPTDPGGTGGTVTLSATEKNSVAASLNALATHIGVDADTRRFVNALAFAVQQASSATDADVTTNLDLRTDAFGATSASSSAAALVSRRVLGYSVTVRTEAPGQRTTRGVVVWDAAGTKLVVTVFGNPNVLTVTYPSVGNTAYLVAGQTQVWAATAGNASWTLIPGASVDCPRPLPNVLSACGSEDGTAPFTVSASAPAVFTGNTATGSRTATLGSGRIRVLFINIICGVQGGPC